MASIGAVVKKRVQALMKVSDELAEVLFAGNPVVLRKDADTKTASRFQKAFKEAGARLRVMPVDPADAAEALPADARPAEEPPAATTAAPSDSELEVAELGTILGIVDRPAPPAPDTSHISLSALGTDLADAAPAPQSEVAEVSWDLAEPGTPLGVESVAIDPVIEIESVDFEVEAPGVRMDRRRKKLPPNPPDTSHLEVESLD